MVAYNQIAITEANSNINSNLGSELFNANLANTSKLRAACARVVASIGGTAKIAFCGDSTVGGHASGIGGANTRANAYPDRVAAILNASGLAAQTDNFFGDKKLGVGNYQTYDPRLAVGSSWNVNQSATLATIGGAPFLATTGTNSWAFTPTTAFDTIDIYYFSGASTGTFIVNVDGGATLLTQATAGKGKVNKVTITGVALATHTINITWSAGGATYISGLSVRDSTTARLEMYNMGWDASKASDWASGTVSNYAANLSLPTVAPDCTFIDLTINDILAATPIGDYTNSIMQMVTAALLSGDVILMTGNASNPTVTPNELTVGPQYPAAVYSIAASLNLPVIDIRQKWVSYAVSNPLGLYFTDGVHPNGTGYADIAASVVPLFRR